VPTPYVTAALLDTSRGAGFHVGWTQAITERFEHCSVVNAIDAKTGEFFTVSGPDEYDALVELAGQVGIEMRTGRAFDSGGHAGIAVVCRAWPVVVS
jgi:hypothetical protein